MAWLLSGACLASTGWAAPCTGTAFEIALPGATGVVTRRADVPGSLFPGLWQEGRLRSFDYRIFANGEAVLMPVDRSDGWRIELRCTPDGVCSRAVTEAPPDSASPVAALLEQCFIAPASVAVLHPPVDPPVQAVMPPPATNKIAPATKGWALTPGPAAPAGDDADPVTPEAGTVLETEAESAAAVSIPSDGREQNEDCGIASVQDGSPGHVLQRLIVAAGGDPGPIDGAPGRRTRAALSVVLGPEQSDLSLVEAIVALDRKLCAAVPLR